MLSLSFRLDGVPVPKARARVYRGHAVTPEKTVEYELAIGEAAQIEFAKRGGLFDWPTDARYRVDTVFFFHRKLLKRPVKGRTHALPSVADGDNCLKSVMDGLEGILYVNDRQVVRGSFEVWRDSVDDHTSVRVTVIEGG